MLRYRLVQRPRPAPPSTVAGRVFVFFQLFTPVSGEGFLVQVSFMLAALQFRRENCIKQSARVMWVFPE